MTPRNPILAPHARYRWDPIRCEHQLAFPEGLLILNETAAAVVRLCDGRRGKELLAALERDFAHVRRGEVEDLLRVFARRGLVRDAAEPPAGGARRGPDAAEPPVSTSP